MYPHNKAFPGSLCLTAEPKAALTNTDPLGFQRSLCPRET